MNTGNSRSPSPFEAFPFAAEVYRAPDPVKRADELDELRAELRNEVRALRTHLTRVAQNPELGREVAAIRGALEDMIPAPPPPKRGDAVASFLRARGIEGAAATRIAAKVKDAKSADGTLQTPEARLRAALAAVAPVEPWQDHVEGRRIVAVVGPSGVGKTTTVAKLAARARIDGKSVALVSCDGFRVGAVEQLDRYAELLGASLHVARTAAELAAVLEEETADVVFVDTSGRPPTASAPEAALAARRKKDAPVPVDVILCMPASIRAADPTRVVGIFASLGITSVAITKTDETASPSGLVHGPWAARRPLSIICDGPRVPEDVIPATAEAFFAAIGAAAEPAPAPSSPATSSPAIRHETVTQEGSST